MVTISTRACSTTSSGLGSAMDSSQGGVSSLSLPCPPLQSELIVQLVLQLPGDLAPSPQAAHADVPLRDPQELRPCIQLPVGDPHPPAACPTAQWVSELAVSLSFVFKAQAVMIVMVDRDLFSSEIDDISRLVSLCALDIICETSMGQSVNAQVRSDSDYVRAVLRINDIIQRRQKNPLMWNNALFWLFSDGREHAWALNVLHSFTKRVIRERRAKMLAEGGAAALGDRLAFLDLLLEMEQKGQMTEGDIQQEVGGMGVGWVSSLTPYVHSPIDFRSTRSCSRAMTLPPPESRGRCTCSAAIPMSRSVRRKRCSKCVAIPTTRSPSTSWASSSTSSVASKVGWRETCA